MYTAHVDLQVSWDKIPFTVKKSSLFPSTVESKSLSAIKLSGS